MQSIDYNKRIHYTEHILNNVMMYIKTKYFEIIFSVILIAIFWIIYEQIS